MTDTPAPLNSEEELDIFTILEQVYEQGVYEADEVRYDAMDDEHKGPRMTISEAKAKLKALIATQCVAARLDELEPLLAAKGRFTTSGYGLWVDDQLHKRIAALQASLTSGYGRGE